MPNTEAISRLEREQHRYVQAFVAFGLLIAVLNLAALVLLLASNAKAAEQRELLVECTTPPSERVPPNDKPAAGDCYLRAQSRGSDLVGEPVGPINTVIVLAASCARVEANDTEAEILACIEKGLASK